MFIKKGKLKQFIITLTLMLLLAPTLGASASCFSCDHEDLDAMTSQADCCDDLAMGQQALHFDDNCPEHSSSIMNCCLNEAHNLQITGDENNRRFEQYLPVFFTQINFSFSFSSLNNCSSCRLSLIAPPPQLEAQSTILKRE